jgi:hypothetical protein
MERTWKPTTAGILSIIGGAIGIIGGIVGALLAGGMARLGVFGWNQLGPGLESVPQFSDFLDIAGVLIVAGIITAIVLGIIAIVGGIHALRRQKWGLALAGSICALLGPSSILGLLAIIFVSLGKNEFN